jgi:hypothetical protein
MTEIAYGAALALACEQVALVLAKLPLLDTRSKRKHMGQVNVSQQVARLYEVVAGIQVSVVF